MTGSSQRRREAAFRAGREDGLATAEAERNLFKGKYRSIVTLLNTTRQQLQEIFDHVDDEGDRRYFGSTNHVDWLRDLLDGMDGWSIDDMLPKGDINKMEADPYAEIRALRARAEAAEAELDSRTRALDEAESEASRLRQASINLLASASDTYKKRNGHIASFEDESGEKCWIVPFDAFEALRSALSAQVQGVAGLERLRDVTYAVQHNPNCPAKYLVRLVGKSGRIDLKPYGNNFPSVKHETGDVLGFGKTIDEAIDNALAAPASAKQGSSK